MRKILSAGAAIAAAIGFTCAGRLAEGHLRNAGAVFAVVFSLLAVFFAGNLIWSRILRNRIASRTYAEQEKLLSQAKDTAERLPASCSAQLNRILFSAGIYYVVLLHLLFTAFFCLAPAFGKSVLLIFFLLILTYLLWGLLSLLLNAAEEPPQEYEIPEQEFPILFSVIREAAAEAGRTGIFRVSYADTISVSAERKQTRIRLNVPEISLLTKAELKQILLREMACLSRKEARQTVKFGNILRRRDSSADRGRDWVRFVLARIPEYYLHHSYRMFYLMNSRNLEIEADRFVREHGDPSAYIDACAKISMWNLFWEEPCAETEYYFYEKETPPEDIAGYLLDSFFQKKTENAARWRKILSSELPARIDSHPTFRMRMENTGISEFHTERTEPDPTFTAEQSRLKLRYNEIEHRLYREHYAQLRQARYIARKKILFEYESKRDADETFHPALLADTASAYYGIDTPEAFRILEVILKRDPGNAYALFYKGSFLLDMGEECGVKYLYDALGKNDNFTAAALEKIANFALQYGKQDVLDEYRKRSAQILQSAADRSAQIGTVTSRDRIVRNDLPEERFRVILDFMKEHSQNIIEKIYTAKKIVNQELHTYIYVLQFREYDDTEQESESEAEEKTWEVYRDIFLYLDMMEEQFTLYRYDESKAYADILLQQLPDCCVFER